MKKGVVAVWIQKFVRAFSQAPPVGGLEITPGGFRYALASGNRLITASLRLPPGIINNHLVADPQKLMQALRFFSAQVRAATGQKLPLPVVVSLPFSQTYLQVFQLPILPRREREDAARLNLQMISPIPLSMAYCDWEELGPVDGPNGNQVDYLAAFAPAAEVDAFTRALSESGFITVAVEFSSLALARLAAETMPTQETYLLVAAAEDGLDVIIIRQGKVYFNYSMSWQAMGVGVGGITTPDFAAALTKSLHQVLNFYVGRWGEGGIKEAVVTAPDGGQILAEAVAKSGLNLSVKPLISARFGSQLDPHWFVPAGMAWRGEIPRAQDKLVSLAQVGTEAEYANVQVGAFIRFWRTVLVSALGFLAAVFLISNVFLGQKSEELSSNGMTSGRYAEIIKETSVLTEQAEEFNGLIETIKLSEEERVSWTPFLSKMATLAGSQITIQRIFYQSAAAPVVVSGVGSSEQAVLAFKEKLEQNGDFSEVALPLSNVSHIGDRVSFNLSFLIKESPER